MCYSCIIQLLKFFPDPDASDRRSFTALAIILILMSIAFLVFEVWFRYVMRGWSNFYFFFEAFVRVSVFLLTIIFVFGFWNDCWCAPPWQWQIGALALFMAYINIVLMMKWMPILGVPITMLLNIVVTFITLIYLPVLLILAFAIPFYMVFVREVSLCVFAMYKSFMYVCVFALYTCMNHADIMSAHFCVENAYGLF